MRAPATLYRAGVRALNSGAVAWATAPAAVVLVGSLYVPSVDRHAWRTDLGAHEMTAPRPMPSRSVVERRSREVALVGGGVSFEIDGDLEFRYAVVVIARGGDPAADELIGVVDFERRAVRDATILVDFAENVVATYTIAAG